ncbi:L-2-hydroxyglutarate oxidase [Balneicella halophila]|uniref:L-2-hydroxyglutarate oxidase n=1 Tax=Balneicella halophila TaxID=1537566 RepID=A0A7L4UNZ2_BALHA|nr:L-2-hydroxyglutarate oxidase [Balneicella halophila]PVX50744.1 L-2-hydroxyglutarate oxidase [Balneicella halophila]
MEQYDIIVIGAGIVGLATALRLKEKNEDLNVLIIEKENEVATHQTGHNSGVIHSGIYYKPGSLKAKNCKEGYSQLIDFCETHSIPYELCGKVIVASDASEIPSLENIYNRGLENGLEGLKVIDSEELSEIEPHCSGVKAILVPQTGIIDYKVVCEKYLELIKAKGGSIKFSEKVNGAKDETDGTVVITNKGSYKARILVNCAGLYSDKVAEMAMGKLGIKILPFRGEYYHIIPNKKHLVKNLIYPVPNPKFPFLGVHFTRMIDGGVEAGPNAVLAYAREGYDNKTINFEEFFETLGFSGFQKVARKYWKMGAYELYRSYSKQAFTEALQKLIPEIQKKDLIKGNAGVRAQACDKDGNLIDDFLIFEDTHTVNVCNAPSPAATSSLSIGKTIAERVLDKF